MSGASPTAIGSVVPIWTGGGGGGAVNSVFGRVGNVVAVAGDYAASLVTNDSGVAGADVAAALDTLAGAIAALTTDDVANASGVAGATATAALDTLNAALGGFLPLTGGTLTGKVGQTPATFVYNAALAIDVSTNNLFQQTDTVTADLALTLSNGVDGDQGTIIFQQDGAGGHKITAITAAGRTVRMQEGLTTINTPTFLVASARGMLTYQYYTVNGTAIVEVGMTGDQALVVT